MHYGVHKHTAAELIHKRADSTKDKMGLASWKNSHDGKIIKTDVFIAKNYLSKNELEELGLIVNVLFSLLFTHAYAQLYCNPYRKDN